MKKILLLLAFTIYLSGLFAQGDTAGIQFEHEPWADILSKAKAENKIIFMDAYTDWCGPCKMMTAKVFSQAKVAEYYNDNFINVKVNMEKGEGPSLAEKYSVIVYPTLLFIDDSGTIVHRAVGYHDADNFLALGETAGIPGKRLSGLEERYNFGDRSAQFLYDYTFARAEVMDGSHPKIAEEYLATQKDWGEERNLTFLFRFLESTEGKMFDYFLENKDKYVGLFGETPVARKLQYLINSSIQDTKEGSALEQVGRLYEKVYPERAEEMTSDFATIYYLRAGDIPNYITAAKKHFKTYGTNDWESLNEAAWNFYEFVDTKKDLKKAVKWAQKSVALERTFYNMDTLAALYFKLGKKKKALQTAENAISLAKSVGENYSETQRLLEEIHKL
ncbi:MAG: thiol-disulfide isomerase/thioredoxin [Saprospiraceae bacterium]|jgi:thiol-disulfide isomerase/thioredoxin